MKHLLFALPALAALTANASILAYDNFDYADGSLVPNGGWTTHSGTAGDLQVSGGQAVVEHGLPSEDASLGFGSVLTSGTIYFAFDFAVPNLGEVISGGDYEYFAHLKDDGTDFTSRIDIVNPSGGGDFSIGVSGSASVADATWATDLNYDTFYRLVASFDFTTGVTQLWIDPSLESDTFISSAADTVPDLEAFALRQSDSSLNETILVDGVAIGTTFADVLLPVPEPGATLLGGLGLLALLRRRR